MSLNSVISSIASIFKGAPVAQPVPQPLEARVEALILDFNNSHVLITHTNPIKGSTVHRIGPAAADEIAKYVVASATDEVPVPYLLASIAIESDFDPDAEMRNLGPGGSNPQDDPLGFDEGACQEKERYLLGQKGVTDSASALAYADDPSRAIPHMADLLATKIEDAGRIIAAGLPASADPLWSNPYCLAAAEYNFGANGGAKLAHSGAPIPGHCTTVKTFEQRFAAQLGLPSVFA